MSKQPNARPNQDVPAAAPGASWLPRWLLLGFCLLLAAGGTWALMEFVVLGKVPPDLIGKWVVEGGEQDGATFDFYRDGTMVGRLNKRGNFDLVKARVAVEGDTLLITTQHPVTKSELVKKQTITSLNAIELTLRDDRGKILRMTRAD